MLPRGCLTRILLLTLITVVKSRQHQSVRSIHIRVESKEAQEERETRLKWPVTVKAELPPLPEAPSLCPHQWPTKYVIVTAGTRHNTEWADTLRPDTSAVHYQADDKTKPHYYDDQAAYEATAYTQFMIDYYDCLPEAVAFVHGHTVSWHEGANFTLSLQKLQWEKIPGYTDLNRLEPWMNPLKHRPPYPVERPVAEGDEVFNGKVDSTNIFGGVAFDSQATLHWQQVEYVATMWDKFFGPIGLGPLPEYVSFVCCSQFAVTKARILARSRLFWRLNLHAQKYNIIQATDGVAKPYYTVDTWVMMWPMLLGEGHDYQKTISDDILFPGAEVP